MGPTPHSLQASTEMTNPENRDLSRKIADLDFVVRLIELLQRPTEVQSAYLFGSRARGVHVTTSDVDVAVAFAPGASVWNEVDLQERLVCQLGVPVQVINLAHAGPDIIEAVSRDGIPLVGDHSLVVDRHRTIR